MLESGIRMVATDEEREAVYRFRYDVYVEELGRYGEAADHPRRMLVEPEDETARLFLAVEDGEVVATSRLYWGGDAPFTERLVAHYMLQPFLDELPRDAISVGERAMVRPDLRGSPIFRELLLVGELFLAENRVQLLFGACEPHLLSLYVGQGARTFSSRNINSPDAGYLIPIVRVLEDVEYLRRIGSPFAATSKDWGEGARIPGCVDRLITHGRNVMSQRLIDAGEYLGEVQSALGRIEESQTSAFDGFDEQEAMRALGKSNIIECRAGDRVLKKGGAARNMFVVLDGTFEVRDEGRLLRILSPGEIFGEIAFLLEQPRSADVCAGTDGRILSLSTGTLEKTIDADPVLAAHLLLNISKMLCLRFLKG